MANASGRAGPTPASAVAKTGENFAGAPPSDSESEPFDPPYRPTAVGKQIFLVFFGAFCCSSVCCSSVRPSFEKALRTPETNRPGAWTSIYIFVRRVRSTSPFQPFDSDTDDEIVSQRRPVQAAVSVIFRVVLDTDADADGGGGADRVDDIGAFVDVVVIPSPVVVNTAGIAVGFC